jgi:hypothetical protein
VSVLVKAETEPSLSIQIPWGFTGSQSFIVTTSLESGANGLYDRP